MSNMLEGTLVCPKCKGEFRHPTRLVYEYKGVDTFYTHLPNLKIGYCLNCKDFVCIQKGIKHKDIVKSFISARPEAKDSYKNMMYLMQGMDSIDCCVECGGTSFIEEERFICPICKEGIMEYIPYQGDVHFRLGKKYILPKLIEQSKDNCVNSKKITVKPELKVTKLGEDSLNTFGKFIKKAFFFISSWVYSSFMAFILAIGFGYLTAWFMQFGWTAAVIYFLAATIAYGIINSICMFAWAPVYYFVSKCNIAKWFTILPFLYYGYITVTLPWKLSIDYSSVNYFMAFELSALAFSIYYTMTLSTLRLGREQER